MTREQLTARPCPASGARWKSSPTSPTSTRSSPTGSSASSRRTAAAAGGGREAFAAALAYHDRDLEEELAIIERTRSQLARILRTLPDAALQRVGVHSERGPLTLEKLLTLASRHVHHHLQFVAEKRQALGLPA